MKFNPFIQKWDQPKNILKDFRASIYKMLNDKTFIIDPLTTICKVALLHFMPEGTKLSIGHYTLCIQEYNYGQWLERMKNGDSRRDIVMLHIPFLKAIKWYIIESNEKAQMDKGLAESIRNIVQYTIRGLSKLQNSTYHTDNGIKIILQYFINMFNDAINNNWSDEKIVPLDHPNEPNILTEKIKNNIDPQIIHSISKMLRDANEMKDSPDDIKVLVDCIHNLLINRDNMFVKMMRNINTNL